MGVIVGPLRRPVATPLSVKAEDEIAAHDVLCMKEELAIRHFSVHEIRLYE